MIKAGIDIGNSKISMIVCDINNKNSKKILSFVSTPTENVKKSIISNFSLIKEEIRDTITNTSKQSQTNIKSINLNIPAIDSLSIFKDTEINISGEMINELHIKKAINVSNIIEPVKDFEIILNYILEYKVDNKVYLNNPIGTVFIAIANLINIEVNRFVFKKGINFTR